MLTHIPSMFVACKSDLDKVSQRYDVQPDTYCKELGLPSPISISAKDGMMADLFQAIIAASMNPSIALPVPFSDKYRKQIISSAALAGGTVLILATIFTMYRLTRK